MGFFWSPRTHTRESGEAKQVESFASFSELTGSEAKKRINDAEVELSYSSFVSAAMRRYPKQKQPGRERAYLSSQSQVTASCYKSLSGGSRGAER